MIPVTPGTRWKATVPGGAWVSYLHQVDPAEPWRAAGFLAFGHQAELELGLFGRSSMRMTL